MIKPIHPFPARMAPELAIAELTRLKRNSIVLDPMSGSGTVVRHASELGLQAIGFDMDPLAVLMSRAWTTRVNVKTVQGMAVKAVAEATLLKPNAIKLPWIDEDQETKAFVSYWFGRKQQNDLRRLSFVLIRYANKAKKKEDVAAVDVLKIALSRIIVTKEQCASLARDTSHSRPHRVATKSDFEVLSAFERSVSYVTRLLESAPPKGKTKIKIGDARSLKLKAGTVDAVITSPPYLNAIDYMRGHRMALVWLGFSFADLRRIRSASIGAERAPDKAINDAVKEITAAMGTIKKMDSRHRAMIDRYAQDVALLMNEVSRVLKPGGKAIFVVGNSCLKGTFVQNSEAVACAGKKAGLKVKKKTVRALPERSRYLPMAAGALSMRMRTETVLTFIKN
ncbi:site-specific DNA-methyltransferase [Bradyrhizobium brasilense]|uniref:DNA methyltransferase n=1 Tax=Bradyrhizobium brasilense TaxID=1419277 RepID=UPI0028780E0E|nr:DNA methyltransferase [Bradyrhizobium brasilense]MCP3417923.1 site-specific DNA-methyltransferase [Bradyrhizobium brasilense]